MPRSKGAAYVGFELSATDLEVLKQRAEADDRSVGSLLRIITSEWVARDRQASALKAQLENAASPAKKAKAAGR
jgi:hypothetical protein